MKDAGPAAAAEVNNIVKSYGHKKVVDDVSFSVERDEIFGLIGPNGAGKTTIIRMIMDIILPDSGSIRILGEKINPDSKNKIGYLPEERGLYKKLTVLQTLIYLSALKGKPPTSSRIEELLQRVDLLPHKDKKIEQLTKKLAPPS